MTVKVYEWKCPEKNCKKVIHSTYEKQFDYNKKKHIESHKYMIRKIPEDSKKLEKKFKDINEVY